MHAAMVEGCFEQSGNNNIWQILLRGEWPVPFNACIPLRRWQMTEDAKCCRWGGKFGDQCCGLFLLGDPGGKFGGKTIMTAEDQKANRTPPGTLLGTWPRPSKNNNQCLVGVWIGGNVIIMAWRQIPLCWRAQRGEEEWPPSRWQNANNNKNNRCNCDSIVLECCPCCTRAPVGIGLQSLLTLIWCHCPHHAGIFAFLMLTSLPLLC